MAENKPLVSVIIPAYNAQEHLENSINSVLAQTFGDFELIIVNDASTDGTAALATELKKRDSRIRLISNPHNMGVARSRNYGVKEARAELVAFIDSDDLWREDKLEKQLALYRENPGALIYFTGSAFIDEAGRDYSYILNVPQRLDFDFLLKQNLISCSSVLVRRSTMLQFPMPDDNLIHEDFFTWLSILQTGGYALGIDEPLLIYRLHGASKSANKADAFKMNLAVYRKLQLPPLKRLASMISYTARNLKKYAGIERSK